MQKNHLASSYNIHSELSENKHDVYYGDSDEPIAIINSCDGELYNVTKCRDKKTLTQNISIIDPSTWINHKRDLAQRNNLLTIMSNDGKENMKALDKLFDEYFKIKTK